MGKTGFIRTEVNGDYSQSYYIVHLNFVMTKDLQSCFYKETCNFGERGEPELCGEYITIY